MVVERGDNYSSGGGSDGGKGLTTHGGGATDCKGFQGGGGGDR